MCTCTSFYLDILMLIPKFILLTERRRNGSHYAFSSNFLGNSQLFIFCTRRFRRILPAPNYYYLMAVWGNHLHSWHVSILFLSWILLHCFPLCYVSPTFDYYSPEIKYELSCLRISAFLVAFNYK